MGLGQVAFTGLDWTGQVGDASEWVQLALSLLNRQVVSIYNYDYRIKFYTSEHVLGVEVEREVSH